MKICIAQTNPHKGNICKNIEVHKQYIQTATELHAKLNNANIYIASVLNSVNGEEEDINKLSNIAMKHNMTVFMVNLLINLIVIQKEYFCMTQKIN